MKAKLYLILRWMAVGLIPAFSVGALFLSQGCGEKSCQDKAKAEQDLLQQYINPATAYSCNLDSDCTLAGGLPINQGAAAAYRRYLNSQEYADLNTSYDCRVNGSVQVATGTSCQAGRCVAGDGYAACSDVETQEQTLLAQFVDFQTELQCHQTSDCVQVNTGGFCGPATVNKTAAQGYAEYFNSSQYIALEQRKASLSCQQPLMNGMCAGGGTNIACVQQRCVASY